MNLLILSIGSNPLPNYITAKYLLCEKRNDYEKRNDVLPIPDKIMFVYSSDTEIFKDKIRNVLNLNREVCLFVNLGNKYRSFDFIKESVTKELKKIDNFETIHCNYTGGTKPMAVAISSAIEEHKKCEKKIYSDLSPRTFKLTLRDDSSYPLIGDIRSFVNIDIKELYQLHCLDEPEFCTELNSYYSNDFISFLISRKSDYKNKKKEFYDLWNTWPKKKKMKDVRSSFKKMDENKDLSSEELAEKIKEEQKKLIESLGKFAEKRISLESDIKDWKRISKFICGTYLEEYVFDILTELKEECNITDLAWDIETFINDRQFQVDVIAMKGCQSFVFTCTTDDSVNLCKSKSFEGIYRANQLGGEQSKTVLICFGDDNSNDKSNRVIENIEKDMSQFDAIKNFTIIGWNDVINKKDLKSRLKEIIGGE